MWWDILFLTIAGAYILDYGFANVGVAGRVPIPIVDVIAVVLLARVATTPGFKWPSSLPFLMAIAFVGLTALRLVVDMPKFGIFALRDATLATELSFLFIGYWAVLTFGLSRLLRALSLIFLAGIAYLALYPFREAMAAASPVVGLQRPVPLFGTYSGGIVAVAAFFFFAIVRPFGRWSYVLAAATIPLMAMLQSRGLYLAVPAAFVLILVFARGRLGASIRRGLAITLAVAVAALVIFFALAPEQGRVGKVTPGFALAQVGTLIGRKGPGSPVELRKGWARRVLRKVDETPGGWLIGVGLGPDLAFGFETPQGALVRKPHDDYLEIYARLGSLGFAIFACLLGSAFVELGRAGRRTEGVEGRFLWFVFAQSFVIAVIAATQPLFAFPYGTVPMFVVLGAGLAVAERLQGSSVRGARPDLDPVRP
jgi:hypothetical protein